MYINLVKKVIMTVHCGNRFKIDILSFSVQNIIDIQRRDIFVFNIDGK